MNVDEDVVLTHVRWLVRWFDGELLKDFVVFLISDRREISPDEN